MSTKTVKEVSSVEVMEVIAEVLELDVSEVNLDASVIDDLGADSLDLVDIAFSLGKKFGFKLPAKATLVVAQEMHDEPGAFVERGKLTEAGASLLQQSPNNYSDSDVSVGMSVEQVLSNTLVKHWCNLCNYIANHPQCDGDEAVKAFVSEFLLELKSEAY